MNRYFQATLFVIEIVLHLMVLKRILEITSKMHGKVNKVRTRYALDSRCCTYLCNSKIHENAFVLEDEQRYSFVLVFRAFSRVVPKVSRKNSQHVFLLQKTQTTHSFLLVIFGAFIFVALDLKHLFHSNFH